MPGDKKKSQCQFCKNWYISLRTHQTKTKFCLKLQQQEKDDELENQKKMYEKQLQDLKSEYEEKIRKMRENCMCEKSITPAHTLDEKMSPVLEQLELTAHNFTISNLTAGVDGHCEHCFEHVFDKEGKFLRLSKSKKKIIFLNDAKKECSDGKLLAQMVVNSLKEKSIALAAKALPKLFTRRDETMKNCFLLGPLDDLEDINSDISNLSNVRDSYEDIFDSEYIKMLAVKFLKLMKKREEEEEFDLSPEI